MEPEEHPLYTFQNIAFIDFVGHPDSAQSIIICST
jgi:hypothetical protein